MGGAGWRRINHHLLAPLLAPYAWQPWSVGLLDAPALPAAAHAALGGRPLQTGPSRGFVGYKQPPRHRWRHHHPVGVPLVPLVSWGAPAHVSAGGRLVPSRHYCQQPWAWCPPLVVADLGYLGAATKQPPGWLPDSSASHRLWF